MQLFVDSTSGYGLEKLYVHKDGVFRPGMAMVDRSIRPVAARVASLW